MAVRVRNERREENVVFIPGARPFYTSLDLGALIHVVLFAFFVLFFLSLSRFLSDGIAAILFKELLFVVDERNDARHDTETGRIKVFFSLSAALGMIAYE